MLSKILSQLKASKPINLSKSSKKFSTSDFFSRFSYKDVRKPNFEFSKFIQSISLRLPGTGPLGPLIYNSKVYKQTVLLLTKFGEGITLKNFAKLSSGTLAAYMGYHYSPFMTNIKLSYDNNDFNKKLVSGLTYLNNNRFYPNFICTTAIMQSIMNNQCMIPAVRYVRDAIPLKDGGQVVLDWALPTKRIDISGTPLFGKYYPYQPAKDNKIMFIIHGLTGGSETNYIQMLVEIARRDGYRVAVMNQRGVNQPLTSPIPFHGGHNDDVEQAINFVKTKYPDAPIVAVGTSFGGNQLLRYLGSLKGQAPFKAAVLLSAPFDLAECVNEVENTVYEDFFIKCYLEKNFLPNMDVFQSLEASHGISMEEVLKVKSLRDYHSIFTAKIFNHKDADDYFIGSKIYDHHIRNINIPMLVLHARDDPIAVHKSIPVDELKKNPNIIYAETQHGGHLCWFTGILPRRWYSEPTVQFLDRALEMLHPEEQKQEKINRAQARFMALDN